MPTALITGTTSGLGAVFTERYAARGHDLVLVSRDVARMERQAGRLRDQHGIAVELLPADLSDRDACRRVEARLQDPERPVDVLVNNAGYGLRGRFTRTDVEDEQRMLDVLVTAVMRLTHAAVPPMIGRGRGQVLNVASVAGFVAGGSYSAAKAWVTTFSQGLAAELAGSGVRVTAVCPGFTRTEMHERMAMDTTGIPSWAWLDAEAVVDTALRDADRGVVVSVPDVRYKAVTAMARRIPLRLGTRLHRALQGRR